MARITNKILEAKVEFLNSRLGLNGAGSFALSFGCGGVRLHKLEELGGQTDISERMTRAEMAKTLDALYNALVYFNLKVEEK